MAITCTQMHTRIQYYVYDGYYNCTSFAKDEHLLDEPENKMEVQQSNKIEHEQDTTAAEPGAAQELALLQVSSLNLQWDEVSANRTCTIHCTPAM